MAEPSHPEACAAPGMVPRVLPVSMDPEVVGDLRALELRNPGVVRQLVARFIAREEDFLADPKLRSDALDLGFLRDNAHRMKGSAGALGARRLAECAGRLERAARCGDSVASGVLVDLLRAEFAVAVSQLGDVYGVNP